MMFMYMSADENVFHSICVSCKIHVKLIEVSDPNKCDVELNHI